MTQRCGHALTLVLCLVTMNAARTLAGSDAAQRLATKTRYVHRQPIPGAPSAYSLPDPPGYEPHHLWLLARHGTRWPTMDRIKQIISLESVFKDARNTRDHPWMEGWTSPIHTYASGELHPFGEDELWTLARRLRHRYPNILRSSYLSARYPVISTQVPRTAASAYAFAAGYFPPVPLLQQDKSRNNGQGPLRRLASQLLGHKQPVQQETDDEAVLKRPQAVAINMVLKEQDPLLRFFDMCPSYAQREQYLEQWLGGWMADQWAGLAPGIAQRMGMTRPLQPAEVEALWTLCQFEAGLLGVEDRACSLLSPTDLQQLEWVDDVELLESHGWGSPLNYRIAAPLLQDLRGSLEAAALSAQDDPLMVHSRLLFAHCETIVPLATLMGLFEPELPPTPARAQMPSKAELDRAAPAPEARSLLSAVDTVQDLGLRVPPSTAASEAAGSTADAGSLRTSTDGTVAPAREVPVPPGWYPRTPCNESRAFRGSRVSPFGANMAVVLYRAVDPQTRPAFRVRLLYNEQVIPIPGCGPSAGSNGSSRSVLGADPAAGLDCSLDEFLAATQEAAGGADTLSLWCQPPGPPLRVSQQPSTAAAA